MRDNEEKLVIKISGDSTHFNDTMKGVGDTIKQTGKAIESASKGIKSDIADATSTTKRDFGTWTADISAQMKSFSDTMETLGTKLTKTFTVPLALLGGVAIKSAMEHEDSLGAMEAIYGDSSASIVGSIRNIDSAFGISQSNAFTWSAEIGSMLQELGGLSADEAGKMSVNLLQMAGDMAAMYGGTVEQAYNAIKSGLIGQSRPLLRYGVVTDVNTLKTSALNSGLIKAGEDFTRDMRATAFMDTLFDQTSKIAGQAKRELGNASGQVRSLKAEMSDLAAEIGLQLLPMFVDVLGIVKDVIDWFSNLEEGTQKNIIKIGLFAAAAGPFAKVLSSVSDAASVVVGGFGKLVTAAKDAGGLPGMAAKIKNTIIPALSSPLGIVGAAAAVIGAFVLIANNADTTANRIAGLKKENKKLDETMRDNIAAATGQAESAIYLAERFEYLNGKTDRTKEEQAELVAIVQELNGLYSDLGWEIDKTTGSVEGNTKAVYNLIEAQLTESIMASYNERIIEYYKQRKDAVDELARVEEERARQERENAEKWESLSKTQQQSRYNYDTYGPGASYEYLNNDIELAYAHLQELDAGFNETIAGIANVPNEVKEIMSSVTGEYTQGFEDQANATIGGGEKISAALDQQELDRDYHRRAMGDLNAEELAQLEEYHAGMAQAYNTLIGKAEEYHKKYFSIEQEGIRKSELTAQQAKKNLDKSIEDYEDWAGNMKTIADRVPDDVLEELRRLGPEHSVLISTLDDMTDEELQDFIETWRKSGELSVDAATEELALIEEGAIGIVEAMVLAIGEQNSYINAVGMELGQQLYAGILDGIKQGSDPVKEKAEQLMRSAISSMERTAEISSPSKKTIKIGQYLAEGVGVGVLKGSNYVSQRAREIMNSAIASMKRTAQIYSPSKKTTEMGEQLGQGLANGLDEQRKLISRSAKGLMDAAADGINGSLEFQKPSLFSDGMDTFSFAGSRISQPGFNENNTTINLNGNYTFRDKDEMDYFMNQLELATRRA